MLAFPSIGYIAGHTSWTSRSFLSDHARVGYLDRRNEIPPADRQRWTAERGLTKVPSRDDGLMTLGDAPEVETASNLNRPVGMTRMSWACYNGRD